MPKPLIFQVLSVDADVARDNGHALLSLGTNQGQIVLSIPPDVFSLLRELLERAPSHKGEPSQ